MTLPDLPQAHVATRAVLQRIGTHVIARARRAATTRFGLRATAGGFGTPAFGPDHEVVRVSGDLLVVDRAGENGSSTRSHRMTGSSLAELAGFVGVTIDPDFSVGGDTPDGGRPGRGGRRRCSRVGGVGGVAGRRHPRSRRDRGRARSGGRGDVVPALAGALRSGRERAHRLRAGQPRRVARRPTITRRRTSTSRRGTTAVPAMPPTGARRSVPCSGTTCLPVRPTRSVPRWNGSDSGVAALRSV